MGTWELVSDVKIGKNRRRHVLKATKDTEDAWFETIAEAFEYILDLDQNTVTVLGGRWRYELTLKRLPIEE